MMVKVCGITRREDAEAAVVAGASAIGFVFYPGSPRFVTPAQAAEIGADLDVRKTGIFVDEAASQVETVMRAAGLDVAQLYGGETPADVRIWRAYRLAADTAIDTAGVEAILLDGPANGRSFDWPQALAQARNTIHSSGAKMIIAGGLDASNVGAAIRMLRPWGVDASSKLESAPGVKDPAKVRAFVEAALLAARELETSDTVEARQ